MAHLPFPVVLTVGALLVSACGEPAVTTVAGSGEQPAVQTAVTGASTVPGERPMDGQVTGQPSGTTDGTGVTTPQNSPDPTGMPDVDDEPEPSWKDRPLAPVLLTLDDLPALGLGGGWAMRHTGFNEIDDPGEGDPLCGLPTPPQTSYFVASFENPALGMELELNVMPDDEASSATAFIDALERLATCPDLEDDYDDVSIGLVPLPVAGAERSVVLTGSDATSMVEAVGLTLAAAEADSHLFIVFVARADGEPLGSDPELAVRSLELVLSRL